MNQKKRIYRVEAVLGQAYQGQAIFEPGEAWKASLMANIRATVLQAPENAWASFRPVWRTAWAMAAAAVLVISVQTAVSTMDSEMSWTAQEGGPVAAWYLNLGE